MHSDTFNQFVAGGAGGIAQTVVGLPLDTVKVVAIKNNHPTARATINYMIANGGYRSFYRGMVPPLLSGVGINMTMFTSYNYFSSLTEQYNEKHGTNINKALIGGVGTALPSALIESPTDLIKSHMQTNYKTSYFNVVKSVSNRLRNLYRGFDATLLRNLPLGTIYFYSYHTMYDEMGKHDFHRTTKSLVAGGIAGVSSWAIIYPFDYYKTLVQTDSLDPTKRRFNGVIDCIKKTKLSHSYKGYWPCLTRAIIVNPFIFLAYDTTLGIMFP